MHETFIFDFEHLINDEFGKSKERICVVFVAYRGVSPAKLSNELQAFFDSSIAPDHIIIIGAQNCEKDMELYLQPNALDKLPASVRRVEPSLVSALCLDIKGQFSVILPDEVEEISKIRKLRAQKYLSTSFLSKLRRIGLMQIFVRRRGMLDAGGTYHFVKPSGAHSDRFIRTANVLIMGNEISFIAFWLLEFLKPTIRHIYTDTAAIHSVVYALISLKLQIDPNYKVPVIESFGSYRGLEEFTFDKGALILISASTSGDLEKKLFDKKIEQDKIVTLFYLGDKQGQRKILCDLSSIDGNPKSGFSLIENYSPPDCPLCKKSQLRAVNLIGDQFLPEDPVVKTRLIFPSQRPSWFATFVSEFVGTNVIKCHCHDLAARPRPREIFFDLPSVFRLKQNVDINDKMDERIVKQLKSGYLDRTDRLLQQIIPAWLTRIIHLDDDASLALAQRVKYLFEAHSQHEPEIISIGNIERNEKDYKLYDGTTMVIAGTLVSGRRLVSVSKVLRHIDESHSLQYLIGVSRTRNQSWSNDVKSTLQYGKAALDYDFHTISEIYLPDDPPSRISPWVAEKTFLEQDLLNFIFENHKLFDDTEVNRRIELLRVAPGQGGLMNNLFWNSTYDQHPLSLTPGFSLWATEESANATQADVYFSMVAILHRLREVDGREELRSPYEPHRVLISPIVFDRYNDGVIQASLLRAAYYSELNYEETSYSEIMQEFLELIFSQGKSPDSGGQRRGEASTEFLLALAMKKLRLSSEHLISCLQPLQERRQELPDIQRALLKYIEKVVYIPNRDILQ